MPDDNSSLTPFPASDRKRIESECIGFSQLSADQPHAFSARLARAKLRAMCREFNWRGATIKRFDGEIIPIREGWELHARIIARVTMDCVISGEPVPIALDFPVHRRYLESAEEEEKDREEEFGAEDDTDLETLPDELDLGELLGEAMLLELPDYPKSKKYANDGAWQLEPDDAPGGGEMARPFARLKEMLEENAQGKAPSAGPKGPGSK